MNNILYDDADIFFAFEIQARHRLLHRRQVLCPLIMNQVMLEMSFVKYKLNNQTRRNKPP